MMNLKEMLRYGLYGMLVLLGACTSYYQVSDPAGNKLYYTTDIDEIDNGAIKLRDEKTGMTVTLQSSEVKEISREEYDAALKGQSPKR